MALWDNVIGRGTHANRPAPGAVGALYFESDTGNGYRDSGVAWDLVTSPAPTGALAVQTVSVDSTVLATANRIIFLASESLGVFFPLASACAGQTIYVCQNGITACTLACSGSDNFHDGGGLVGTTEGMFGKLGIFLSDGVDVWYSAWIS